MKTFWAKLRAFFRKEKLDGEMAEEMRFHLNQRAAENREGGLSPDEAHFAARRQFGHIGVIQEIARDDRGWPWLDHLFQDLRYAQRSLRKNLGFTAIAVITLALGVGASTALFSVVNAVLLQSLPFPDAARLVWVGGWLKNKSPDSGVTPGDFADYRAQSTSFVEFAASVSEGMPMNLTGNGEPERLKGGMVTANFMETFGVPPMLGRTFAADEGGEGNDRVAVLSHGFWVRRYGADPGVVGRVITLDGRATTVIGVMPPGFQYPAGVELWKPISVSTTKGFLTGNREFHLLRPIGRLKTGVALEQAQAELDTIAQRLAGLFPKTNIDWSVRLFPLAERLVGGIRPTLKLILGAVGCVLLIACANVANLLLARAATRQREMGVRTALGAGRSRIVRQLLTENLLLALLGGAGGVLLAHWLLKLLVAFGSAFIPHASDVALNLPVLGFALGLALLTGLLFGLIPALDSAQVDVAKALSDGGRGAVGGVRRHRILRALVVAEIALSVVLLVSAGLLLKSFLRLQEVAPGFDATSVLTLRVDLPNPYAEPEKKTAFFEGLQQRIAALPGVEMVGQISELPVANQSADAPFKIDGRSPDAANAGGLTDLRTVNEAYFSAMRVPLLRGRGFTAAEVHASAKVAIISDGLAQKFFRGENPIGQRIRVEVMGPDTYEIIGVVGDVRHRGLDRESRETFYYPSLRLGYSNLAIRTAMEPASLIPLVRREAAAFAPNQPIANVKTMEQWVTESVAQPRFRTWLIASFSLLALVIAVIGIYGVMAYAVAQRTNEFGIRMALGARSADLVRMVLRQGMKVTLAGVALGLAAAFAATRLVAGLLFGVPATDFMTFAEIATLLTLVGLLACYVPARRAGRVDPMVALRRD